MKDFVEFAKIFHYCHYYGIVIKFSPNPRPRNNLMLVVNVKYKNAHVNMLAFYVNFCGQPFPQTPIILCEFFYPKTT